jgi:lipoprotein-anchoring transpeptidase ErfK/SrfK
MSGRTRPRYGRIVLFTASVVVTGTAVLGGLGILPSGGSPSYAAERASGAQAAGSGALKLSAAQRQLPAPSVPGLPPSYTPPSSSPPSSAPDLGDTTLPADSGTGRRVVFAIGRQRVWLVNRDGSVERTYPVSGSMYDNLAPGTYSVYSRSRHAVGVDDSGTMGFMVRFAHGATAAIGFHSIPMLHGKPVQTRDELGTPLSHGCIRQARPDARALWQFAPLGTTVVVTA